MQPIEPENLEGRGSADKVISLAETWHVVLFVLPKTLTIFEVFPKKKVRWMGFSHLVNSKNQRCMLISLGPWQNQLFVARECGPRLWIIRVWKIRPLAATLRILFITNPVPCYPTVNVVKGSSLKGLGISYTSATFLPKTWQTKYIMKKALIISPSRSEVQITACWYSV